MTKKLTSLQILTSINNNTINRQVLINALKKFKIVNLTRYTKNDLIIIYKLSMETRKNLFNVLKDNNIKGRTKLKKDGLLLQAFKIKKKEIAFYDDLKNKLRLNRVVSNFSINQHAPISLTPYLPIKIGVISKINTFKDISSNSYIKEFNNRLYELLIDAYNNVEKIKVNLPNYVGAMVQVQYIVEDEGATPRYSPMIQLKKDMDKFKITINATDISYVIIGYKISLIYSGKMNNNDIRQLKAYNPTNNIKFHELSVASTSGSGLCIYETWRHINKIKSLKYSRRDNKDYREKLYEDLKNEGNEIEKCIKNGELVNSLCKLTEKYNKDVLIHFFGSHLTISNTMNDSISKAVYSNENKKHNINGIEYVFYGKEPIYINKGKIEKLTTEILKNMINKECFLYEIEKHVAPSILKISEKENDKKIYNVLMNKLNTYNLKKKTVKSDKKIKGIFGFDCETFLFIYNDSIVYNITLYGILDGILIKKSYYGLNCIDLFIDYLVSISTKMNYEKSRAKEKIDSIYIYGFNNSNFDNIFIYKNLYSKDPNTKYVFTGNSIKYIKYNNLSIYDIKLFYNLGSLRDTCEKFNLEEEKGVFPYDFVNKDNLNYIGEIPDIKYWNNKEDYDEYLKNNGNHFNMKEYTEKYCLLDSKLVFELAKLHIENCTGSLNGKKYNVVKSPTSANLSIKMFSQVFQSKTLYSSPKNIIEMERDAYYGGRTEVFKKQFNSKGKNDTLHYFDRNSSYPASMTEKMPNKYINTFNLPERKYNINEITDYYLYRCKVSYKGNNKYYIPNIFSRTEKGNIISVKNTDYGYHWGCEVKEAILSDCEVIINQIIMYEAEETFKSFSEYFYNERLKVKKTNTAKSLFYKTVMNSLYGKMGQKQFNDSKMCKYDEIPKIIGNDLNKLINIKEIDNNLCLIEFKTDGNENNSIGNLVRFSSYISALSRTNLCSIMRDVGYENLYYCDTDSIFSTKKPSNKFLDQNILGLWKEETKTPIKNAYFLAPKVYTYECFDGKNEKAMKGMKKDNVKNIDMINLCIGNITEIKDTTKMFFRNLNGVKIENQERTLKCVYNKRIWNGNNSQPYNDYEAYLEGQK